VVGVLDADIRSFERDQIDSLFYPVVVKDYDFSKAYYHRVSGDRLYGRVKRLLIDPLLIALRKKLTEPKDHNALGIIDFLQQFNYQLSGEVAFNSDILKKMHFATNWGAEIFTLIEIYHKATSVAQVMFSQKPFDHKHQDVSEADETRGLNRMAIDIVTTLINVLVEDRGMEVSDDFFRDLALAYSKVGERHINMYSDEAAFNNLTYDRDEEERLLKNVFRNCILRAGEILTTQSMITGRFMRVIHTYPEFKPHLDAGLADTILSVEKKIKRAFFETPQTVSWERITTKLPNILKDLNEAIKKEKKWLS
jgi:glucosyl-3-phosphoglycerate synthase